MCINVSPSCACACQLMTFLIVTDTYICMYVHVHHENRSLIQSLALMRSAIIVRHSPKILSCFANSIQNSQIEKSWTCNLQLYRAGALPTKPPRQLSRLTELAGLVLYPLSHQGSSVGWEHIQVMQCSKPNIQVDTN